MNNENDILASSESSASREAESVRQSGLSRATRRGLKLAGSVVLLVAALQCFAQSAFQIDFSHGICILQPLKWFLWGLAGFALEIGWIILMESGPVEKSQPDASQHPGEANKKGL